MVHGLHGENGENAHAHAMAESRHDPAPARVDCAIPFRAPRQSFATQRSVRKLGTCNSVWKEVGTAVYSV